MITSSLTPVGRRMAAGWYALIVAALAFTVLPPTAAAASLEPMCDGRVATIVGTAGDDVLVGTSGPDVIVAGDGKDQLDGGAGDDVLCGEDGRDHVVGGEGADKLIGGNGKDSLVGGSDSDVLVGGNGKDDIHAGPGQDYADGGQGHDTCVDAESTADCEDVPAQSGSNPLTEAGRAPPGIVPVNGPDGVRLVIQSGGGIQPWDVTIARDKFLTQLVADSMVSPAYQILVPEDGVVESATLTLPYREDLLGGFPEDQLRVYHFDDDLGLWTPAYAGQRIDAGGNSITVAVEEFSAYGVFKLGEDGFSTYWDSTEVFCLQQGDADNVGADVAFLIDTSGSIASADPNGMRVQGAKQFVDAMGTGDRAGVVSFSGSANTRAPLTSLATAEGRARVKQALDASNYAAGGTNIAAAVDAGLDLFEEQRIGRARVMILMTDGHSSYDAFYNDLARDAGVVIYTIGLGGGVNSTLLQGIADATGGRYLHLSDPNQLPDIYSQLAAGLLDNGEDSDGDGLTDCEETYGVLTSYSFYDVSLDPDGWRPLLGEKRTTSDPSVYDTDADGLADGEELGEPIDLRDYEGLADEYGFLIDAGITTYYYAHSDPNEVDSDQDSVGDFPETRGSEAANGEIYTSWADRTDSDFDLLRDDVEYRVGTDPLVPDGSEVGIDGLMPFTLFQHESYQTEPGTPVVQARFSLFQGEFDTVTYLDTVLYDDDFNCVENCSALIGASSELDPSWCWTIWFGDNCSTEEKVRNLVEASVHAQNIFTASGDFRGDFVAEQGVGECLVTNASASACTDPAVYDDLPETVEWAEEGEAAGETLDQTIASVVFGAIGGYNPKNLCGKTGGGVYRLVETIGEEVITRYVGQTKSFEAREKQHRLDPRFRGLEFQRVYETDNYQARRGLEQRLFNDVWGDVDIRTAQQNGSLNGQRPMSTRNIALTKRLALAQKFLDIC